MQKLIFRYLWHARWPVILSGQFVGATEQADLVNSVRAINAVMVDADHKVMVDGDIKVTLSVCLCVCMYVCLYFSTIKRKPLIGLT